MEWDKGHEGPRDLRFCTSVADVLGGSRRPECLAVAEAWAEERSDTG